MDTALRWFVRVWVSLFLLLNLAAVTGLFLGASSFWGGLPRVGEYYSLSNLGNWIVWLVLLSPAIGAQYWLTRRRERRAALATQDYAGQVADVSKSLSMEPTEVVKSAQLVDDEIGEVFDLYGGYIANRDTSIIRDVKELPLPKSHIEATLLRAISRFEKYPQLHGNCEIALRGASGCNWSAHLLRPPCSRVVTRSVTHRSKWGRNIRPSITGKVDELVKYPRDRVFA